MIKCPACFFETDIESMPSYVFSPATMDKLKVFDERSGTLIFDKDINNPEILRHRNYYLYLDKERKRLNKKHKILNLSYTLLGSKNLLWILNMIRKFRQPSLSTLLADKHFSYGEDKEYLRFIAQK